VIGGVSAGYGSDGGGGHRMGVHITDTLTRDSEVWQSTFLVWRLQARSIRASCFDWRRISKADVEILRDLNDALNDGYSMPDVFVDEPFLLHPRLYQFVFNSSSSTYLHTKYKILCIYVR